MKVALYARVSMDEGNKEDRRYQEPENQLAPLREWAQRQGWEIAGEYVDRGSGADPNRPQFRQLIQDAMMLRFTTIIVWKLDRFSRENMSQVVGRIQKLRERGIGVQSLTESWLDTRKDNPMSDLIMAMMAWAASEERRKISERTKAGIAQRRGIGQWKGGRPKNCPICGLQTTRGKYSRAELCNCPEEKGPPETKGRKKPVKKQGRFPGSGISTDGIADVFGSI
jgi:DNA invertase Pin-like site-specific DNA recombinase